ncbi:MAG: hypothetical protein ACRCXC_08575 [Legionella sp.]
MNYVVSAIYKFVSLNEYRQLRKPLLGIMKHQGIRGTLLLAQEGINGTVAGSRETIDALYAWVEKHPSLKNIVYKESFCQKIPFNLTKVKLKKRL